MSKAVVFGMAFLFLFAPTLVIPIIPPGDIISSFLGFPENVFILGISIATIVNGIINGLVWGLAAFLVYLIARPAQRKRELEPMRASSYTAASKPTPTETTVVLTASAKTKEKRRSEIRKRKTYTALDLDIETIEGIGPAYGNKLRNSGVKAIEDLLREGSTRHKRRILAPEIGVSYGTLLRWVRRADFFRIKGIGTQYSSLLESAGVNTVTELSRRNPKNLHASLKAINRKRNLVRRIPPYRTIQRWITNAGKLARIVED
jgi:predicted flap endonuclease-1-like 5' DNA nuclease